MRLWIIVVIRKEQFTIRENKGSKHEKHRKAAQKPNELWTA
jgi:hypothetical protein